MTFTVVHCGTGNLGRTVLAGIINHPDLQLVGQYVWSPDKVGVDSGTLAGRTHTGVTATNDWAKLLDLDADCLCYCGDSIGRELEVTGDICQFLERGTNAVAMSVFPWAHPATCPPEFREPVDAACQKGNTTAFFAGIDPGWATTDLAIAVLACAGRVDCVRVMELGWWGDYTAEFVCREYFGFGKEPGFQPLLITGGFLRKMWDPTLHEIAHALGVTIEDYNIVYEGDALDHDVETGFGTVRAGTAAAIHFELQGLFGGRPVVVVEHNDQVARDAGKKWKLPYGPGELAYRIEIEGDATFSVELNFDTLTGGRLAAMPPVNAIPAVCAASPGLKGPLEIPRY